MCVLFFSLLFLAADPTLPDVPKDWDAETRSQLMQYAKQSNAIRKYAVMEAIGSQQFIAKAKARTAAEKKEKTARLNEATRQVVLLKAGVIFPETTIDVQSPRTGDIGVLRTLLDGTPIIGNSKIDPVLLGRIMLSKPIAVTVVQVGSDRLFVTGPKAGIVLVGMDQTDIVDESEFEVEGLFRCVGPVAYPDVSGSKSTLFTYERFPVEKLREWEALRIAAFDSATPPQKK